jgi:hypothetical protein
LPKKTVSIEKVKEIIRRILPERLEKKWLEWARRKSLGATNEDKLMRMSI